MKEKFEAPKMEMIFVNTSDVIRASQDVTPDKPIPVCDEDD